MRSAKPAYQVAALLLVFAFIQSIQGYAVPHVRSVNLSAPQTFVNSIFDEFGSNNSMNTKQFSLLLKELKIGSSSNGQTSDGGESKCYSAKVLFESFSVGSSGLNPEKFEKICPAMVQQIESKACLIEADENNEDVKQSTARAWGFGFLSVTIISCTSLLGAFVVPFMNQSFYKILLLFMVSLAVGVLSGSGFFHLIPHSYELEGLANLWKSLVIVGGIYLFFFLEYLMKMIVRFKEKSVSENGPTWHHLNLSIHNTNDIPDVHNGSVEKSGPTECGEVTMMTSGKKKANPVAWMIIVGDGLHNFIDGLAIGASYSSSTYVGISTSLAIFCEELPHELGDFAILLSAGMSYKMAMAFNFFSACGCYLGLVIGLILGTKPQAVMWIYPLAGGMFVYISLVDMLAEASEMSARLGQASIRKNLKTFALQNVGMLFGFLLMSLLGVYKKQISVN